jgi:hypothetical protein
VKDKDCFKEKFALASWPDGYSTSRGTLSVKVVCTEAIVGKNNWKDDAFAKPVFPNPKNDEEAFSCAYSEAEKEAAKGVVVYNQVCTTKQHGGLLFLDANEDPLFPYMRLVRVLTKDFGFQLALKVFGDLIQMFVHPEDAFQHAIIFLHRPLCKTADSCTYSHPFKSPYCVAWLVKS